MTHADVDTYVAYRSLPATLELMDSRVPPTPERGMGALPTPTATPTPLPRPTARVWQPAVTLPAPTARTWQPATPTPRE